MQQTYRVTPPRSTQTCLVVEHSEFDSEKLIRMMAKSTISMHVEVAATLCVVRDALRRRADLILLDNNLPDGLGADFAIELSDIETLADIRVIIVSDWPPPFIWVKAASAGVSYVLSKTEIDQCYVRDALQQGKPKHHRAGISEKNPATRAGLR